MTSHMIIKGHLYICLVHIESHSEPKKIKIQICEHGCQELWKNNKVSTCVCMHPSIDVIRLSIHLAGKFYLVEWAGEDSYTIVKDKHIKCSPSWKVKINKSSMFIFTWMQWLLPLVSVHYVGVCIYSTECVCVYSTEWECITYRTYLTCTSCRIQCWGLPGGGID